MNFIVHVHKKHSILGTGKWGKGQKGHMSLDVVSSDQFFYPLIKEAGPHCIFPCPKSDKLSLK
jgi:hypothetical protein